MAACRGAINALMAEILEEQIRLYLLQPDSRNETGQAVAAEELIEVIRRSLK